MNTLSGILYTGVSGIYAAQAQIDVTSSNIANINNANYSTQKVTLSKSSYNGGVTVTGVTRMYDDLLAKTLRNEQTSLAYWESSQSTLSEVMTYFNELPDGIGIGSSLEAYFTAWSDLSSIATDDTSESLIYRATLIEAASVLCTQIKNARQVITDLQNTINNSLSTDVNNINNISQSIAKLNGQIASLQATGGNANDLLDKREELLNSLAQYANITTVTQTDGSMSVYLAGEPLVDGGNSYSLEVVANEENGGNYDIVWKGNTNDKGTVLTDRIKGGTLQASIDMRDSVLNGYISQLDDLASSLIYETNKLHAGGVGLEYFTQLTASNAVTNPKYTLNSAEGSLPFAVESGTFQINVYDSDNNVVATYDVVIDPETDTLNGIAEKISVADGQLGAGYIEAYVNSDGELKIYSQSGYTFSFGTDTSGFLAAAGFNSFFTGTDASNIDVDSFIKENPSYIAAASAAGEVGNNENALAIAALQSSKVLNNNTLTFNDFYSYFTGTIALDKQQVDIFYTTKSMTVETYSSQLSNIMHVSLDEESTNLVLFQRILEANSRLVNAVDSMMDTVINNMGLVGR